MPPRKKPIKQSVQTTVVSNTEMIVESEETQQIKEICLNQWYLQKQENLQAFNSLKLDLNLNHSFDEDLVKQFQSSISHIKEIELNVGKSSQLEIAIAQKCLTAIFSPSISLTSLCLRFYNQHLDDSYSQTLAQCLLSLERLRNLKFVFQNNTFSSKGGDIIFNSIRNIPSLKTLETFHFEIGQNNSLDYKILSQAISNMNELRDLKLTIESSNKVGAGGAKHLSNAFKNLTKLQFLHLNVEEKNQIGSDGWRYLGESLQSMVNLKTLILFINDFNCGASEINYFFKSLSYFTNLVELNFEYNSNTRISSDLYGQLKESLYSLKNLRKLYFTIEDPKSSAKENQASFAKCFQSLTWVEELKLEISKNLITNSASILNFSNGIGGIKNLTTLPLSLNADQKLTSSDIGTLANTISRFKSLEVITMTLQNTNRKKLEKKLNSQIFEQIGKLQTLKKFFIEIKDSTLDGNDDLSYLPLATGNLVELKEYCIKIGRKNKISQGVLTKICESIKSTKSLINLSINISDYTEQNEKQEFCKILEKQHHLKEISFIMEGISPSLISAFGSSLSKLKNLESIQIEISSFGTEDIDLSPLSLGIAQQKYLKYLSLSLGSSFSISSKAACSVVNSLKELIQLNTLSLGLFSDESYHMEDQIEVINSINNISCLSTFTIQLHGQIQLLSTYEYQKKSFLSFYYHNQYISFLQNKTTLTTQNLESFSKKMRYLEDATSMEFKYDQRSDLTSIGFDSLSSSFSSLKNFTQFSLFINPEKQKPVQVPTKIFDNQDISFLFTSLQEFENLKELNLTIPLEENLGIDACQQLKSTIQKLIHLEKISIQLSYLQNDFEMFVQLMEGLQSLKKVIHINIVATGASAFKLTKTEEKIEQSEQMNEEHQPEEECNQMEVEIPQISNYIYTLDFSIYSHYSIPEQSKMVSDIGRILELPFQFQEIGIEIEQPSSSILHLCRGLKNQKQVEIMKLFTSFGDNLDRESYYAVGESVLALTKLKQLDFYLFANKSVEITDLFNLYALLKHDSEEKYYKIDLYNDQYKLGNRNYFSNSLFMFDDSNIGPMNNSGNFDPKTFGEIGQCLKLFKEMKTLEISIRIPKLYSIRWEQFVHLKDAPNLESLRISLEYERKEETEQYDDGASLASFLGSLHQLKKLSIQFQDYQRLNIHPFQISYPKVVHLEELSLYTFQLNSSDSKSLLEWIGMQSQLRSLNLTLSQKIDVSPEIIVRFGQDLQEMKNLEKIRVDIQKEEQSLDLNHYFAFCVSLGQRKYTEFEIKLKGQIEFVARSEEQHCYNIGGKKDDKFYYIRFDQKIDSTYFLDVFWKYFKDLTNVQIYLQVDQPNVTIKELYPLYMKKLKCEKKTLEVLHLTFNYDEPNSVIELFQKTFSYTSKVNLLQLTFLPEFKIRSNNLYQSFSFFKFLKDVSTMKVYISGVFYHQCQEISKIIRRSKIQRLVDFTVEKCENYMQDW